MQAPGGSLFSVSAHKHNPRDGAKPSPAAGTGKHVREQWRRAASACSIGFRAGGSPPEGQEGRRRTEGAEKSSGGRRLAVTELGPELWGGKSFGHFSWAAESPFRL